jgi:hypothetical protein
MFPSSPALLTDQSSVVEKETEILVVQLLVEGYLRVNVRQTKFTSYAYLIPSANTHLITRNMREDLAKSNFSVRCHFPIKVRGTAKGKNRAAAVEEDPQLQDTATDSETRPSHPTKRKREVEDDSEDDENVIEISSEDEDDEPIEVDSSPRSRGQNILGSSTGWERNAPEVLSDSGEGGDAVWIKSLRQKPRQRRRTQPGTMADLSDFE